MTAILHASFADRQRGRCDLTATAQDAAAVVGIAVVVDDAGAGASHVLPSSTHILQQDMSLEMLLEVICMVSLLTCSADAFYYLPTI